MIQLPKPDSCDAEQIKITLSSHAFAPVREAFLGSKARLPSTWKPRLPGLTLKS